MGEDMYLKEIKAQGFKSFADLIQIELKKGITGIVGPNGSGKSNVVDAVRWVLGEQSVKSLRGEGNMADVIFSGSKSRNAQNVATVTLVFDNSDHFLNLNYNEISIKRRVYKDGSNEYYLNGEKCRLKDVQDILLDSGIAKESFNIISQGKIEEILSSKPSERRVIFEEAACVLKYKKRKEEALRKLDRTHENMNRVKDIIGELEIQIEPLKKQRDQAILYKQLEKELEQIDISLIAFDIQNMNEKYQQTKKQIQNLNDEMVKLTTSTSTSEAKLETIKGSIQEIEQKLKQEQEQLLKQTEIVEHINSKKTILLERQKYQVEDAKLHTNLLELQEKKLQLQNEMEILKKNIESIKEEYEGSLKSVLSIEKEIQEKKRLRENFEKSLSTCIREKNSLENKIEIQKEQIENNSTLPSAVRSVLNHPKLTGIHNIIGKVIECEDQYVNAITTVLGTSSYNIIVENEKSAEEAILYLKNNHIGRATFFPISVIKPRKIEEEVLESLKGIPIHIASSLVQCEKIYRDIIENQLGNVLVVKDLKTANMVSKKIHQRYRVVTLEGEICNIGGSITGGTLTKNRNSLTEKFELENNLKAQGKKIEEIKEWENKINEIDYQLTSLEDRLYLKKKEQIEKQEGIERKKASYINMETTFHKVEEELEGTNQILNDGLSKEEENILKEYYDAISKKNDLMSKIESFGKEKMRLQETLEQLEFETKKENSQFQIKNKELRELEIEENRMDVKLDTLLNQLNENYNLTYEHAIANYPLQLDESSARNKVSNLKRQLKDLGEINPLALEEYDKVKERYEFLITQRDDLVQAENTLLDIICEMDEIMKKEFEETFSTIRKNFQTTFQELFKGGTADLKLTNPEDLLETGIDIVASPPGKKLTTISLLSGGEKTFTAISLLFAIIKSRPSPFCILDEVEAALDEVNVDSFGKYIQNLKDKTQFIVITHKKKTMEYADVLYGITMQESGVSKLVSVKLEDIETK